MSIMYIINNNNNNLFLRSRPSHIKLVYETPLFVGQGILIYLKFMKVYITPSGFELVPLETHVLNHNIFLILKN
jgi:hypothetical protein